MFLAVLRALRQQRELLISSCCSEARLFSSSRPLSPLGPSCRSREPSALLGGRLRPCEPAGPAMQPLPAARGMLQATSQAAPSELLSCAMRGPAIAAAPTAGPSATMRGTHSVAAAAVSAAASGPFAAMRGDTHAAAAAASRPYSSSGGSQRLLDMRHPASWYPLARQTKRTIIAHLGPTNSGMNHALACAVV